MQDIAVSMMKFSTAMTMFGVQQIQNAMQAFSNSPAGEEKFKHALDAVTQALTAELNNSNKSAQSNIFDLGEKLIDRAAGAMDVPALDPRNVMKAAADVMQRATEAWAGSPAGRTAGSEKAGAEKTGAPPPPPSGSGSAGEPQLATAALNR